MKRYAKWLVAVVPFIAVTFLLHQARYYNPYHLGTQPAAAASAGINIVAVPESSGSVSINWQNGPYARVAATGSPAAGIANTNWTLSNPVDGSTYTLEIDQDTNAGGETVVLPTAIVAPGQNIAPGILASPSSVEVINMTYNSGLSKYIINSVTTNQSTSQNTKLGCQTQLTLSAGAVSTTGAPSCFSQYSRVGWVINAGSPTGAVLTPTALAGAQNVACAQAAANSTTLGCTSATAADTRVITVFGII